MRISAILYDLRSRWKSALVILLLAAAAFALLFPFPKHEGYTLDGVIHGGEELRSCQIVIDGTLYRPLLRDNQYKGTFSISTEAFSLNGAVMQALREDGQVSHMFYSDSNGMTSPGYYVAPDDYAWLYIRLQDGREIIAAQQGKPELEEIRLAAEALYGRPLPE